MRNRLAIAATAVGLASAALVAAPSGADAAPGVCATWGCGAAEWDAGSQTWIVTVQDTKTDGACVGTMLMANGRFVSWGPTSCGGRETQRVNGAGTNAVRIVRWGNYLTVAGA